MPSMAADGVGAQALVLGPEIPDWRNHRLDTLPCEILINGQHVADGRDQRPNPTEILVATVNEINARGMTVEAGQVVTTGAAAVHPAGDDAQHITVRFPEIGDIDLTLT